MVHVCSKCDDVTYCQEIDLQICCLEKFEVNRGDFNHALQNERNLVPHSCETQCHELSQFIGLLDCRHSFSREVCAICYMCRAHEWVGAASHASICSARIPVPRAARRRHAFVLRTEASVMFGHADVVTANSQPQTRADFLFVSPQT